jgi:DNA-binding SARP family transcriptional activator
MQQLTARLDSKHVEGSSEPSPDRMRSTGREVSLSVIELSLLGVPRVTLHGGQVVEIAQKAAALLALAAMDSGATRRLAATWLWPDSSEALARNNLRTLMHRQQRQFGVELFEGGELLMLAPRVASIRELQANDLLAKLAASGPSGCRVLGGLSFEGLAKFQAWLDTTRRRVTQHQLVLLGRALEQALEAADASRAVSLARACVALEPLSERWHRQLMETHVALGDRAAALAAYADLRAELRNSLGAWPDERTRGLHVSILREHHSASSEGGSVAGPREAGELMERELAMAQLESAYGNGHHVALSGEAGVGKTRLLGAFAVNHHVHVLRIQPCATEVPYAALAQTLTQIQRSHVLSLRRSDCIEFARIAPAAFPEVQPSSAPVSVFRLWAALSKWAQCLYDQGVRQLVLDDVHYADELSQAALAGLISSNASEPHALQIWLSYRPGDIAAPLADAILSCQALGRMECVSLQRLSGPGIEKLLRSLGFEADQIASKAQALLQSTGGNPLFVVTQSRFGHLGQGDTLVAGASLQVLLQSLLERCTKPARDLAILAGVAGPEFSVELAAALTSGSALDLMPAWTELQKRGLFADSDLAHDLVRDAVHAATPPARRVALHRQFAEFLENEGAGGAGILRHWLAAAEPERAFPHALKQWRQLNQAGLGPQTQLESMFVLIESLKGTFLLENLWTTAELTIGPMEKGLRHRLACLIDRVEAMANSDRSRAWVAFERSRLLLHEHADIRSAHALLLRASRELVLSDAPQCWVEMMLIDYAARIDASPHVHARRMVDLAARLPVDLEHDILHRRAYAFRAASLLEHAGCAREAANGLRAALRRGDLGEVRESRLRLAHAFSVAGADAAGARHFRRVANPADPGELPQWHEAHLGVYGRAALRSGRYDESLTCFNHMLRGQGNTSLAALFLAWAWLLMGSPDKARHFAGLIHRARIKSYFSMGVIDTLLRSRLELEAGGSGLEALRAGINELKSAGAAPALVGSLEIELADREAMPEQRLSIANRVLSLTRAPHPMTGNLTGVLLALAEAQADCGHSQARDTALEAASLARRGRAGNMDYRPDILVRCAKLLRRSDPKVSDDLHQVARSWLRQALLHVPDEARQSFILGSPTNRALLDC